MSSWTSPMNLMPGRFAFEPVDNAFANYGELAESHFDAAGMSAGYAFSEQGPAGGTGSFQGWEA